MNSSKEDYVMLRGRVINKWYDIDERAHYHITVQSHEDEYDVAINVGSIRKKQQKLNSTALRIYYDENYNHIILDELIKHRIGISLCSDKLKLDYIRMKLFDKRKIKKIYGISNNNIYLMEIIENNVKRAKENEEIEIFVFGNMYENKKGIHDIHMNQGSLAPYNTRDRIYSDGGVFFFNKKTKKWTSLFIMFENQSLHTDENGKIKNNKRGLR